MLKQRLLTIVVILPLFIAALFLFHADWFAILLLVVLALGLYEWSVLSAIDSIPVQVVYVIAGLVIAYALIYRLPSGLVSQVFFLAMALHWVIVAAWLARYNRAVQSGPGQTGNGSLGWLNGYIVLIPAVLGLHILKAEDVAAPRLLLVFFFIIWAADTGAYLAGRKWGKNKLAPGISPGKTIEGVYGGLGGTLVVALVTGTVIWKLDLVWLIFWLLAVILITLFSVTGDLYESVYKRRAGVKDSGTILPGHGGILDRIDSTCAALPFYMSAVYILGLINPGSIAP